MISWIGAIAAQRRTQLLDAQIVGTDAFERREHAVQHVIAAAKAAGALDGDQIRRLATTRPGRRRGARPAERARVALGQVHADRAEADLLFDLDERRRQRRAYSAARAGCGTPGARPSSRRCRELGQLRIRRAIGMRTPRQPPNRPGDVQAAGHRRAPPGAPAPCDRLVDGGDDQVLEHLRFVGSMHAGSISSARSPPLPVMVHGTMPPPAAPSTVLPATSSRTCAICSGSAAPSRCSPLRSGNRHQVFDLLERGAEDVLRRCDRAGAGAPRLPALALGRLLPRRRLAISEREVARSPAAGVPAATTVSLVDLPRPAATACLNLRAHCCRPAASRFVARTTSVRRPRDERDRSARASIAASRRCLLLKVDASMRCQSSVGARRRLLLGRRRGRGSDGRQRGREAAVAGAR